MSSISLARIIPKVAVNFWQMPELPDVVVYIESLRSRLAGRTLQNIRLRSPFLLRSVEPPLSQAQGKRVVELRRLGKRIVIGLEEDLFLVFHLMIAGRFYWRKAGAGMPGKRGLAAFDFPHGTLLLTEAGSKKRASLYLVQGEAGLEAHDPGGVEVLALSAEEFRDRLMGVRHTLKRTLTDPQILSGIGNAYSDEILHAARLSPFRLATQLSDREMDRLHEACREVLTSWTERLRRETGDQFPEKVTAFREGMAVHGRFRQPCPVCATPVQRIRYAENEANYCPQCQTGGKLLADRALSRLLRKDWPKTLEEMERQKERHSFGKPGNRR